MMHGMVGGLGVCSAASAVLCGLSVCAPTAGAEAELVPFVWQPSAPEWAAYEVGAGGQSIIVGFVVGCGGERNAAASVTEARGAVTISLRNEVATYSRPISCPPGKVRRLKVSLRRPLDGRELVGASSFPSANAGCSGSCPTTFEVPGVVGFSLKDARTALALVEMSGVVQRSGCVKTTARRGVISQKPGRTRLVPMKTPVRLCVAKG